MGAHSPIQEIRNNSEMKNLRHKGLGKISESTVLYLGLHCLPRPVSLKTFDMTLPQVHYGLMLQYFIFVSVAKIEYMGNLLPDGSLLPASDMLKYGK